jgi:aliphatic nitrilase
MVRNGLARYALHAQAEQLHVSHWPPAFPTRPSTESLNCERTNARRPDPQVNLPEATRIRVAAHCFEGKCFGVICGSPLGDSKQLLIDRDPSIASWFDGMPQSSTMFLNPAGQQVGEERSGEDEGIAYATFDLNDCIEPKQFHDFVGGYQRYDVFKVTVNRERQEPVSFIEDARPERLVWNQSQPSAVDP